GATQSAPTSAPVASAAAAPRPLVRFTTEVAPHLPPQQLHTFTARDLRHRTPTKNGATRRVALTLSTGSRSNVLDFAGFVNTSLFIHNIHTCHRVHRRP